MARQKGIIKLKGTIGDITFYKTQDGYVAKEKSGIEKNRILNDPAFQRTRENNAEFGRAGKAGKMLRTAFKGMSINASDRRMVGRLTQQMVKVIQADAVNERGLRNVIDGEAELLQGFEFNINSKFANTLYAPIVGAIDRALGKITVDIAPFIPINMLSAPSGATHYKIISGGAEIDFEAETYVMESSETAILPWDATATVAVSHVNNVTVATTKPLFLAVGIEFYQNVNAQMYPLKNGSFNPLALVMVSGL
ncbi:MAG TPA: hypothetical protein VK476_03655 [Flavobacterium sp.]|nr:hypothetical protein [Flavobacterium sp.]